MTWLTEILQRCDEHLHCIVSAPSLISDGDDNKLYGNIACLIRAGYTLVDDDFDAAMSFDPSMQSDSYIMMTIYITWNHDVRFKTT